VVRVKEEAGGAAFFCTDPTASVQQILEALADRATLAQNFHDQGDSNLGQNPREKRRFRPCATQNPTHWTPTWPS
jgi:hypothetical protein